MNSVLIDKPGMSTRSAESVRAAVDEALASAIATAGGVISA